MKLILTVILMVLATSAFAQRQNGCREDLQIALRENQDLRIRLAKCEENNRHGDREEVQRLRREIADLRQENRALRDELDRLRNPPRYEAFICAASCTDMYGNATFMHSKLGSGSIQAEAEQNSRANLQAALSCTYGLKVRGCEQVRPGSRKYCTVACTDMYGNANERYTAGAYGRNTVEAEVLALEELKKNYTCNYNVKVISCN